MHPPTALRSFKRGVGRPEAANRLGTTSEYADDCPGGQVQRQGLATFIAVHPSPWLIALGGRQTRAHAEPLAAQVDRGAFSPYSLARKHHPGSRMVNY